MRDPFFNHPYPLQIINRSFIYVNDPGILLEIRPEQRPLHCILPQFCSGEKNISWLHFFR
jgi:hypothetical protein